MGTLCFHFFCVFFSCVCVFFPCVLCASRSPGHGKSSTSAATSSPLRVRPPIKNLKSQTLCNSRRIPKQLHRLVTFPCDFPQKATQFRANFSMRLPPNNCTILCQLFHVTSPQKLYNCVPTFPCATHLGTLCIESRRLVFT